MEQNGKEENRHKENEKRTERKMISKCPFCHNTEIHNIANGIICPNCGVVVNTMITPNYM